MHPCGRFNRNTLQNFLRLSYPHEQIRILHRLDATTTGVLLLARNRDSAAAIQKQFAEGKIHKTYLARVNGHPANDRFECDAGISETPVGGNGVRQIDSAGWSALTKFQVLRRDDDGNSLIKCFPITGRTHQIRLHLSYLGWPIVGDSAYGTGIPDTQSILNQQLDSDLSATRLHLHASAVELNYPAQTPMKIQAPDPDWV